MGWIIFAIVILFIFSLFFICVKIIIQYDDALTLTMQILFLKFTLYPKEPEKIKISDYSIKNIRKRHKKLAKKDIKKDKKNKKDKIVKKDKDIKSKKNVKANDIISIISLAKKIVFVVFKKFLKYLRIDVTKINIVVASDDAAKTALIYGGVVQLMAYLMELLSNITSVKTNRESEISVVPDFTSEIFTAQIYISFRLKVWHFLSIGFSTIYSFIKEKNKKSDKIKN